jgi:secreted trypsin-like serine protease
MSWGEPRKRRLAGAVLIAVIAASLWAAAAAPASSPGAQASIINGQNATIAEFPSLAFIVRSEGDSALSCTGTVISPRLVLTAAHCIEDLDRGGIAAPSRFTVVTGLANPYRSSEAERLDVAATHVFPQYNPGTGRGDAGLLVLASPTSAPPIALATAADAPLYAGGATVSLAGWGLTRFSTRSSSQVLQATSAVVENPTTCKGRTQPYQSTYSPAAQMCTSSPPGLRTGGCFGDSGGPAIAQRADGSVVEIGVISTGGPGCSTKVPNVFTRADLVSTWAGQWVAATEAGAPVPAFDPVIPRVRTGDAIEFANSALEDAFGERFSNGEIVDARCRRFSQARVACALVWRGGPKLYYGRIAVFYTVQDDAIVWDRQYRFRAVGFRCWLRSDNPGRCPARVFRG